MLEIKYKNVPLNELFIVGRGSAKYTKAYANQHKGKYPVYSSKTDGDGIFAYIDTYDFNGNYLSWSTDGYAGVPFLRNGKFSCTDHCGILSLRKQNKDIYLPYIQKKIDFRTLRLGFGNQRVKVNQVRNANILIQIPIRNDGTYDYEKQQELATQYEEVEKIKNKLATSCMQLENTEILISSSDATKMSDEPLLKLLDIHRGNAKYTKAYCQRHTGDYPVYSADNANPIGYIKTYDFDVNSLGPSGVFLTMSTNGIAGIVTIINSNFSCTGDRVVFTKKVENLNEEYLRYVLQPIFRAKVKGRKGHNGQNEFTKLPKSIFSEVKVPIPITEAGDYNLFKQKELAERYRTIEEVKNNVISKIKEVLAVKVQ